VAIRSESRLVASEAPSPSPGGAVARRCPMRARLAVHLCLLATFAASLATVTLTPEGTPHLVVGLAFVALAGLHVAQRRHTIARLLGNLGRTRKWFRRRGRLAWSDVILALLALNVLASGIYDLLSGNQVILHPREVGIPFRDIGWHVMSALVLLVYLCVHVVRRSGRIRHSAIR
jgi:hypothetical protein